MDSVPTAIIDACVLYSAPVPRSDRAARAGGVAPRPMDRRHSRGMDPQRPEEQPATRTGATGAHPLADGRRRPRQPGDRLFRPDRVPDAPGSGRPARGRRRDLRGRTLILTFNLADFPPEALAPHGVTARHPDALLVEILDAAPDEFCEAVRLQRGGLKNPPMTVEELLARLESAGLTRTAATPAVRGSSLSEIHTQAVLFVRGGRQDSRGVFQP